VFEVEVRTLAGAPTAIGSAGPLTRVRVSVHGDFTGDPPVSTSIDYDVEIEGDAPGARLRELVEHVDRIAEIPNSLRDGRDVRIARTTVG
jgi:hypothetical protein